MKTVDQIITNILNREGPEYTNIPGDKGGPTKYGITLGALQVYRNHPVSAQEVQNLTEAEAKAVYMQNYVVKPGYGKLAVYMAPLIEQLIDAGVNHGTGAAIKMLQNAVGVNDTGVMDETTIQEVNVLSPTKITLLFLAARSHFYGRILDVNKSVNARRQWQFAAGWFNRVGGLIQELAGEVG